MEMRSTLDLTRFQFLSLVAVIWVILVIFFALFYYFSHLLSGVGDGRWDTYGLIVAVCSLPYGITILLVNIFCVFRGERGYDPD